MIQSIEKEGIKEGLFVSLKKDCTLSLFILFLFFSIEEAGFVVITNKGRGRIVQMKIHASMKREGNGIGRSRELGTGLLPGLSGRKKRQWRAVIWTCRSFWLIDLYWNDKFTTVGKIGIVHLFGIFLQCRFHVPTVPLLPFPKQWQHDPHNTAPFPSHFVFHI